MYSKKKKIWHYWWDDLRADNLTGEWARFSLLLGIGIIIALIILILEKVIL